MLIGLFIRNIKAHTNISFIPMSSLKCKESNSNFVTYIGKNGVGKSSILEAMDAFFNNKPYIINKKVTNSSYEGNKYPFILPIFVIEKHKIKEFCAEQPETIAFLEEMSEYFWSVDEAKQQVQWEYFWKVRNDLPQHYRKDYHFFVFGEKIYASNTEPFLPPFVDNDSLKNNNKLARHLNFIKELYSYIYFPVEIDAENFTKLKTNQMQKIIGKPLKEEIKSSLKDTKIKLIDINRKLSFFLDSIKHSLDGEYEYKPISQKKNITENDLVEKILEAYFDKKVLHRHNKRISELSAGEKRQALISIATAFLKESNNRDKYVIIAIDEPEASLHTQLCYEQFEKLYQASQYAQIFITTHWYGFLPIIDYGYAHFLVQNDNTITFESYSLYDYRSKIKKNRENNNSMPSDFILKSTNDLVQSIYYSVMIEDYYNWLIVEGITEKIYFEVFFKDLTDKKLRILPLGGFREVKRVYEFLELPMREIKTTIKGKIYCLIDTDINRINFKSNDIANLCIRRLCHKEEIQQVHLLATDNSNNAKTDIEQCLNVKIFAETYKALGLTSKCGNINIKCNNGNTNFINNLNNTEIEKYFKENNGENKVIFAKKYIEILTSKEKPELYIPNWTNEIRKYFESQRKS